MNIVLDFRSYRTESLARYVTTVSIPEEEPAALRESFRAADVSGTVEESCRAVLSESWDLRACAAADDGWSRKTAEKMRKEYRGIRLIAAFSSTSC
jgi:hypothetical protein